LLIPISSVLSLEFELTIANRWYSVRGGYAYFCLFDRLGDSRHAWDSVAFFVFFSFKGTLPIYHTKNRLETIDSSRRTPPSPQRNNIILRRQARKFLLRHKSLPKRIQHDTRRSNVLHASNSRHLGPKRNPSSRRRSTLLAPSSMPHSRQPKGILLS
jgi:hypothetical protein